MNWVQAAVASKIFEDLRLSFRASLTLCRKIAWSKNGCVAYISPDGDAINLKVFSRDADTGKWDLGKDVPVELPQRPDTFPCVHLSWSHLGNDLAVMDAAGRVMLFSMAMALDRLHFVRAELAHPEAEVDGVVGMHWLALHPYEAKVRLTSWWESSWPNTPTEPYCVVDHPRWQQVELAS
jgi:mediator of RNA polymerase II transcription subunit 16